MAKRCDLTGKQVMTGNNVSHAHNKTRRRFEPNLQKTSLYSDALGEMVRLKLSTGTLRTVEHKGGLDAFLLDARKTDLTPDMQRLRRRIEKAAAQPAA